MSRAQSLLFGVAVVFAGWNILNNGLSVRSGAIALLIIICLVINIYNNNPVSYTHLTLPTIA